MSHAVDANVLLYASDEASPLHPRARAFVDDLGAGPDLVYVFWPVVMAYLRIATHPTVFAIPVPAERATANMERLLSLPNVRSPGEGEGFWDLYRSTTADLVVRGDLVADAHLVTLMRQYGVRTIWTRDRDFAKFRGIDVRDPFA